MGVGKMLVRGDQLAIYPDMELAVVAGHEGEGCNVLAHSRQRVARHPGGPERMPSMLAIFNLNTQFVICHETASSRCFRYIIGGLHNIGQQHLDEILNPEP